MHCNTSCLPVLGRPSLLFTTDSMNWHTYLLEPEISWGGECEWRVVNGFKRKKEEEEKKATVECLEGDMTSAHLLYQDIASSRSLAADTIASTVQTPAAEPWRKDRTST